MGYFDDSFNKLIRRGLIYKGIDPEPTKKIPGMLEVSVENFKTRKKFDIVVASNVLENTQKILQKQ